MSRRVQHACHGSQVGLVEQGRSHHSELFDALPHQTLQAAASAHAAVLFLGVKISSLRSQFSCNSVHS